MLRPKLKLERLANCTHATIESLAANFEGCPLVDASAIAKSAPLTDAPAPKATTSHFLRHAACQQSHKAPILPVGYAELTVRQTGKMRNVVGCFVTTIIIPALLVTDINDPALLVAAVLVGANRASRGDCTSPGMRWLGSAMLLRAAALAAALEATTVLNSGQGRPAVGQVLYTWGLNDRRQLGASSCVRDRVLNIFQCRADSANRQRPSSVDTLNYTNISHISMSRDTTFVRQQTGGAQRWLSWGDRQRIGRPLADEAQDDGSFLKVNMSGTPVEVEGLRRAAHVAAAYRCGCQWDVSIILTF